MQKLIHPLVSIIVITYNSSKYVLETLESAKAQTYQNIELIVSDDCSTDNTVQICRNWIQENKEKFIRTELLTVEENTGISPNCNRGAFKATGEWIKLIAGDDRLKNNCIDEFVKATQNNDSMLFLSGYLPFSNETELDPMIPDKKMFNCNPKKQLKKLMIKGATIAGFTFFINGNVLRKLNGYSEKYLFCEDTPLAIKFLKNGFRMDLVPQILFEYREHNEGISTSQNSRFTSAFNNHFVEEVFPLLKSHRMYLYLWHYKLRFYISKKLKANNNNIVCHIIIAFIKLLDPIQIYNKFRSILNIAPLYSDHVIKL